MQINSNSPTLLGIPREVQERIFSYLSHIERQIKVQQPQIGYAALPAVCRELRGNVIEHNIHLNRLRIGQPNQSTYFWVRLHLHPFEPFKQKALTTVLGRIDKNELSSDELFQLGHNDALEFRVAADKALIAKITNGDEDDDGLLSMQHHDNPKVQQAAADRLVSLINDNEYTTEQLLHIQDRTHSKVQNAVAAKLVEEINDDIFTMHQLLSLHANPHKDVVKAAGDMIYEHIAEACSTANSPFEAASAVNSILAGANLPASILIRLKNSEEWYVKTLFMEYDLASDCHSISMI